MPGFPSLESLGRMRQGDMTLIPDVLLIPYGTDSWSIQTVGIKRFGDGSIRLDAPFPCAAINRSDKKPLRLNSEAFTVPPNFNAREGLSKLTVMSDHLKSFCRPWDKLSVQFIDAYFDHIHDMLNAHRDTISAKLAPFDGLYVLEDWAFSAPKPLPRAHLYAPRSAHVTWDAADFVQADVVFWLGERIVAALAQPGPLTPARARERLARLEQVGVDVVHFTAEDLEKNATALFHRIIGDFLALLDSAGAVPIGPFRPQILQV